MTVSSILVTRLCCAWLTNLCSFRGSVFSMSFHFSTFRYCWPGSKRSSPGPSLRVELHVRMLHWLSWSTYSTFFNRYSLRLWRWPMEPLRVRRRYFLEGTSSLFAVSLLLMLTDHRSTLAHKWHTSSVRCLSSCRLYSCTSASIPIPHFVVLHMPLVHSMLHTASSAAVSPCSDAYLLMEHGTSRFLIPVLTRKLTVSILASYYLHSPGIILNSMLMIVWNRLRTSELQHRFRLCNTLPSNPHVLEAAVTDPPEMDARVALCHWVFVCVVLPEHRYLSVDWFRKCFDR